MVGVKASGQVLGAYQLEMFIDVGSFGFCVQVVYTGLSHTSNCDVESCVLVELKLV